MRHAGDGFLILDHLEGRHPCAADLADEAGLRRCVELLAGISRLRLGAALHIDRSPAATLINYRRSLVGSRFEARVSALAPAISLVIRHAGSTVQGSVHGDVHPGNLITDGRQFWLIDWEYAGKGEPLADLASLVVNALPAESHTVLACWPAREADSERQFAVLRLAATLRDLFWGYAEALSGAELPVSDYLAINEDRVAQALAMVNES